MTQVGVVHGKQVTGYNNPQNSGAFSSLPRPCPPYSWPLVDTLPNNNSVRNLQEIRALASEIRPLPLFLFKFKHCTLITSLAQFFTPSLTSSLYCFTINSLVNHAPLAKAPSTPDTLPYLQLRIALFQASKMVHLGSCLRLRETPTTMGLIEEIKFTPHSFSPPTQ